MAASEALMTFFDFCTANLQSFFSDVVVVAVVVVVVVVVVVSLATAAAAVFAAAAFVGFYWKRTVYFSFAELEAFCSRC